jgi:hypothetical protein
MTKAHIEELQDVVVRLHGAEARHVESVPVKEQHEGKTVWEGVVEVFDLTGHPKTNRVYAWMHDTGSPDKPKQHVTVLHIDPALSPAKAVRVFIIQEFRNNASAQA